MLGIATRITDWHCALQARDIVRRVARGYLIFAMDEIFRYWIGELTKGDRYRWISDHRLVRMRNCYAPVHLANIPAPRSAP